jgi:hypothetical protein
VSRQIETDNWPWISLGSGIGAAALFVLLLYAPNGMWKVVLIILLAASLVVLLANPRNRILALGTATSLAALAGFVSDISLNLSATFPGGGVLQGGVEGGTDIPPVFFLLLLIVGLVAITIDALGRGWMFPSLRKRDATRPELSFVLNAAEISLGQAVSNDGQKRFHVRLLVSKEIGDDVRLANIAIKDANVTEFAIGAGDGVQVSQTIEGTRAGELSILGDFPVAKLSRGRAKRKVVVVDEFNRHWLAGTVTFQDAN